MALSSRDEMYVKNAVQAERLDLAAQRFIDHTMLAGGEGRARAIELVVQFVDRWNAAEQGRVREAYKINEEIKGWF